jgi:hypothetical protein
VALNWAAGEVEGSGADAVGPYTVAGTYDPATGRVEWRKKYMGKHSVAYRGVADASGVWGVWEIRLLGGLYHDRGGFHVWPEGGGKPAEADRTEQAVLALMREEFGHPLAGVARFAAFLALAALGFAIWRLAGY